MTSLPKTRPNYDNTPEAFSALTTWLPTYLCVSPSKAKNFLKARTNAYVRFYPKHLAECLVLVSTSYVSDVNSTENGDYRQSSYPKLHYYKRNQKTGFNAPLATPWYLVKSHP